MFPVFFRTAKTYLRMEWIKVAAVVFCILLYSLLMVNDTRTVPMTYESFVTQYCSTNKFSYSSQDPPGGTGRNLCRRLSGVLLAAF